jgi:ribonuclease VapC
VIVVDSSALIIILIDEPEADHFIDMISTATDVCVATPTLLETISVLAGRHYTQSQQKTYALLDGLNMRIAPFDEAALHHALDGLLRYGKGRHGARLNFGDCISYGLAKALDAPLLFKGDDFALTDVTPAYA